MMELTGKEYRRRLVPVTIEVKQYVKAFCKNDTKILQKIWDKCKSAKPLYLL